MMVLPVCPDCGARDWHHLRDDTGTYSAWWSCSCRQVLTNLRGSFIWWPKLN